MSGRLYWRITPNVRYREDYIAWTSLHEMAPHGSTIKLAVCQSTDCSRCMNSDRDKNICPACGALLVRPSTVTSCRFVYECICGTALACCSISDELLLIGWSEPPDYDII